MVYINNFVFMLSSLFSISLILWLLVDTYEFIASVISSYDALYYYVYGLACCFVILGITGGILDYIHYLNRKNGKHNIHFLVERILSTIYDLIIIIIWIPWVWLFIALLHLFIITLKVTIYLITLLR